MDANQPQLDVDIEVPVFPNFGQNDLVLLMRLHQPRCHRQYKQRYQDKQIDRHLHSLMQV